MCRTCRMGAIVALLTGIALLGVGCKIPVDIHSLKVPEGFDFSTTQDILVKVSVADADGKPLSGAEVVVAGTQDELLTGDSIARGATDEQGQFNLPLRLPARFTSLSLQATVSGAETRTDASILNNEVSVAFGPES